MRRKDREMDEGFGFAEIDRADFGVLSLVGANGEPVSVPLSIARDGRRLYFHSATKGEKVEALQDGGQVRVVFVSDVRVPDLYPAEELELLLQNGDAASALGSKVFTTEFASAIVQGRVFREYDDADKKEALRVICQRFVPARMAYFDLALGDNLDFVAVYRIEIDCLTAKRKKYGSDREELKFQRTEPQVD